MASVKQSQTRSSEETDTVFAALLKPIKDLTENWEVPLDEFLEGYLDEIKNIQVTFDGTQTTINFAEAGLILQGTASVYSKKVDYLWTQLLNMLENLTTRKGQCDIICEGSQVDALGRVRKKAHIDMAAEFEELIVEIAKNIDIKGDHGFVEKRKGELTFIFPTPRQLIEKEGSTGKQIKVNIFMGHKMDLLGAKEDFRVNSQYVASSGRLAENLSVEGRKENKSVSYVTEDSIDLFENSCNTSMEGEGIDSQDMGSTCMDLMEITCDGDMWQMPGDDHEPMFTEAIDDSLEVTEAGDRSTYSAVMRKSLGKAHEKSLRDASATVDFNVTPEPDLFDPWKALDPHTSNKTPKPLRKGTVIKYPPSILEEHAMAKEGNENGPERVPVVVPIDQFLADEMTRNMKRFPRIQSEFYDLALLEHQRRKDHRALQKKKKREDQKSVQRSPVEEDDHDDDAHDICSDFNEDEDLDDADCGVPEVEDQEVEDLPDPHLGGDIGAIVMHEDYNSPEEPDQPAFSYEALVTNRVAQFIERSQSFVQTSALTKRVSAWHDHMAPRLETVERRQVFDIHQYGSRLLDFFGGTRRTVAFSQVMRGKPREEIARFFLSTLMLANTMNVQVGIEPDTNKNLRMDNVTLTLLTTKRHHEQLEDFEPETRKAQKSGPVSKSGRKDKTTAGPAAGRKNNHRLSLIEEQSNQSENFFTQLMEDLKNTPVIEEGTFLTPQPPKKKSSK